MLIEQKEGVSLQRFWEIAAEVGAFELVRGEVVRVPPNIIQHNNISTTLFLALLEHSRAHGLGKVVIEGTFALEDRPDWVRDSRIPDVMFFAKSRLDTYIALNPDYLQRPYFLVPDWVAEVISPNDRPADVLDKLAWYLQVGVREVWLIYPARRRVAVYTPDDTEPTIYRDADTLNAGDAIPGFALSVAALFAE